jgi:PadR family transcriptional regulator, regulatory protein PadR
MAKSDHLKGALELLVLKFLRRGANHGYAIATAIEQTSDEVLRVEEGSLYPALHRMTAKGRKKLEADEQRWQHVTAAVAKVLRAMS